MKKTIIILWICTCSILSFSQTIKISKHPLIVPYIQGQYDVCVNGPAAACGDASTRVYSYSLQNFIFPSDATNIDIGWDVNIFEGAICNVNNSSSIPTADIMWYEYSCGATANVKINYVSYMSGSPATLHVYNPNLNLSVNDLSMGPMNSISGSSSIAYANTNQVQYSIPAVCGATYYEWIVSGSGWTVDPTTPLTGSSATTIKVNPSQTTNAVITVKAWLDPGKTCNYYKTQSINISRPIEQPTYISPASGICLDNTPNMTYNINPVANALSYTWIFPNGWTGSVAPNGLSAIVNFNSLVKTDNICVKANFIGGVSSAINCVNVTCVFGAPFAPDYSPTLSSSSTPTPSKWNVQISFPTISGGNYNWSTTLAKWIGTGYSINPASTHTGVGSGTSGYVMANYDRVYIDAQRTNPCTTSEGNSYIYEVHNGAFTPVFLPRMANSNNEVIVIMKNLEFKIFPNPTSDNLNIDYFSEESDNMSIIITDVIGNIILREDHQLNEGGNNINLQLKNLSNGIYFLNLDCKDFSKKEKIVIEK